MPTARIQGNLRSAVSKTTKTINQTQTMPNPKISRRRRKRLINLMICAPQAGDGDESCLSARDLDVIAVKTGRPNHFGPLTDIARRQPDRMGTFTSNAAGALRRL